jgi:CRP-like cAMP-binding protein
MRPIATQQDAARYPLDEILGAPANVRLLRVLADLVTGAVNASDAAQLSGLTAAGARRALQRLVKTGLVRRVGGRRSPLFELREGDPLTSRIRELFRSENERYRSFLNRLKELLTELPEVRVAWVDAAPDEAGKPFHIGVLSDSRSLTYLGEQIRQRIGDIERDFDMVLEIHVFSAADAPNVDWDEVELLAGYPKPGMRSATETAIDRDDRSVRLSIAIAKLLDEDPGLLRRAMRHLEQLLKAEQGPAAHDLREWQDVLTNYSPQRVRDFIVSDTPRAQRLRRSSPFFAVLSADERSRLFDELERAS